MYKHRQRQSVRPNSRAGDTLCRYVRPFNNKHESRSAIGVKKSDDKLDDRYRQTWMMQEQEKTGRSLTSAHLRVHAARLLTPGNSTIAIAWCPSPDVDHTPTIMLHSQSALVSRACPSTPSAQPFVALNSRACKKLVVCQAYQTDSGRVARRELATLIAASPLLFVAQKGGYWLHVVSDWG